MIVDREPTTCPTCGVVWSSTQAVVALFSLVLLVALVLGAGFVWGYQAAPDPVRAAEVRR